MKRLFVPAALLLASILTACGGAAPAPTAAPTPVTASVPTKPASAAPAAASAAAPASTAIAAAAPAATAAAGPVGSAVAAVSGAANGKDACGLVPAADLGGALGKPVTRQQVQSPTHCIFYTDDPMVFLDLTIDRENAADSWKGVNGGNAVIGAGQQSVPGLGDQAFFGPRDRLYVLKGNTFLAIEAGFDDKVRDRATKVAQLALTRAA